VSVQVGEMPDAVAMLGFRRRRCAVALFALGWFIGLALVWCAEALSALNLFALRYPRFGPPGFCFRTAP